MKRLFNLAILTFISTNLSAQSWLTNGNSGLANSNFLGTTDAKDIIFKTNSTEHGRLKSNGSWRFGSGADFVNIDAAGKLSFTGSACYLVPGNKYVFQVASNPNYGLFFNSSTSQYEFRNGSAASVFTVNANTGNGVFNGTLKVGAFTLPAADGTSGQVLQTNGAGLVNWATIPVGGANTSLSNLASTSINQSLIPSTDSAMDLGSKLKAWKNLFLDGKIGVNVDPAAKLHIRASVSSPSTYSLKIDYLNQLGLANPLFNVRDDGRVGIGVASPAVALDVLGDAQFNTNNTTDCDMRLKTTNTDMGWYSSGSSNKMGLYNYAANKTLMKVLGTGEVSITGPVSIGVNPNL